VLLLRTMTAFALITLSAIASPVAQATTTETPAREGAHDFDFDLGSWRTEIVRRVHPLSGSDETKRLSGIVMVRPLWKGKAQVEEIEADGANGHWEGLTVFLYDPGARQWSMNFTNSATGRFTAPMVGGFRAGRGELIGSDTLDGRAILVRAVWSDITLTSHTYQESYSDDGGHSWQIAFTAHKTKISS
jgi:hypothetical protein